MADAFIMMRYPFDSDEARELNKRIFATIYYACLRTSCRLAQEDGPYETFYGSPASKGVCNSLFPNQQNNDSNVLVDLHVSNSL